MDQDYGRQKQMQPESTGIPRPQDGRQPRPSVQVAAPPRPYQHRPGPEQNYRGPPQQHRQRPGLGPGTGYNYRGPPMQHHDRPSQRPTYNYQEQSTHHAPQHPDQYVNRDYNESPSRSPYANPYEYNEELNPLSPPRAVFHKSGRHLSHISAMSDTQRTVDSRPVSEADPEYVADPAFAAKEAPPKGGGENNSKRINPACVVRQASLGKKAKPTITNMKGNKPRNNSLPLQDSKTLPPEDQSATMETLTAAIRQGLAPVPSSRSETPYNHVPVIRMPFGDDPGSPTSVYTETTAAQRRSSMPLSSYHGYDPQHSKPSTISEQDLEDFEKSRDYEKQDFANDLLTPSSYMSALPVVQQEQTGMSPKTLESKRPPRLDIDAVREAQARGSMTSLSDLIRRATRVASNLDRGRTASRLGHLDMFGSREKLGGFNVRASTYSDVLDAFPAPDRTGTPNSSIRPTTVWPNGKKGFGASKSSLGHFVTTTEEQVKPERKCCGMSPPVFVFILVILILLIAAAVLVPVFLVVIPRTKQSSNSPTNCATTNPCQNRGVSVMVDNTCSCICVDGFTGSTCSTERDPECVTASLSDGSTTYNNATIGSSVLPLLREAQSSFNISLNTTNILSTFTQNNLSCASENSLVDFKPSSSLRTKRFIMFPGMMQDTSIPHVPALNLPASESKQHRRFIMVDGLEPAAGLLQHIPHLSSTSALHRRQDESTASTNGIVFAATSTAASAPSAATPAPTDAAQAGNSSDVAATSSSGSAPLEKNTADDKQLNFAGVVVLYVLQSNEEINSAVSVNQAIVRHLRDNPGESIVNITSLRMEVNLDDFTVKLQNGTVVGGV